MVEILYLSYTHLGNGQYACDTCREDFKKALEKVISYLSDPDNPRESYIVSRAREAAKQGRKVKLGLFMITQNPKDIDGAILKQTNTNIFLGLREEVIERVPCVPCG